MTETEKKIRKDIVEHLGQVKIFWDMDGTCASMEMHKLEEKLNPGFFDSKRPIKTILRVMKDCFELGAETYILSFCSYYYQKEDKIKWLNRYCEFISEDKRIIIPRRESDSRHIESKSVLKAEYLKDYISNEDIVYVVDDNEAVLLGIKANLPQINIISPIDFID